MIDPALSESQKLCFLTPRSRPFGHVAPISSDQAFLETTLPRQNGQTHIFQLLPDHDP